MIKPEIVPGPPKRLRLAVILMSPVLLVTLVGLTASFVALANLDPLPGTTGDAGLARIGDALAVVIVAERGPDVVAVQSLIVRWGILTPVLGLIASAFVAWWISGRVSRSIGAAQTSIETAEEERQSRMEEVVHELRTPLAVMGTNLELAAYEAEPSGGSARYIEVARRAVGRMARTVDDLDGHGQLAVEMRADPIDLSQVAEAVVEENKGPARSRGVRVRTATEIGAVAVSGVDPAALGTAIGNFMSNAMRMAPRGSEVVVDCGVMDGWAWFAVRDEGSGIAPQHHLRVFERGWQGAHDRDRHDGSGLGLTIARQMTEAQGGLITVESEEGGGAVFALWLPTDLEANPDSIVARDRIHSRVSPWARSSATI